MWRREPCVGLQARVGRAAGEGGYAANLLKLRPLDKLPSFLPKLDVLEVVEVVVVVVVEAADSDREEASAASLLGRRKLTPLDDDGEVLDEEAALFRAGLALSLACCINALRPSCTGGDGGGDGGCGDGGRGGGGCADGGCGNGGCGKGGGDGERRG